MIRWLIIFIGFLISSNSLSAQNSFANTWAFGVSAGLKFGSNPPTPLSWQALRTIGGSAVLNDVNGNLLVYSNGDRNYVGPYVFIDSVVSGTFNSNNQFISIIDANIRSNIREIQPCMFVPQPLKDSVYYLFSSLVAGNVMADGGRYCLAYSKFKVDSRKEIVLLQPTTKLSGISGLDIAYGGLTGCRHSNGQDYWIITSTKSAGVNGTHLSNQNLIFAFLLTDTGLRAPVISVLPPDSFFVRGVSPFILSNLKSSYNGRLLARSSGNTVELLQFNPNTGLASLLRNINLSQNGQHLWKFTGSGGVQAQNPIFYPNTTSILIDTTQFYEYTAYGLAFSPNDSLLYVTNCQEASRPSGPYYGYGIQCRLVKEK